MFDGLKRLWGRIVSMFSYTTLKNIIGKDVALSQTMIDAINKWKKMLVGNADWCDDTVESLKLEEGICREFADSVLVEMRDEAFRRGLEEYKREIEFNVGLAYGDLSDAQEVDKTATEVLASKTRKYNRVTAIQGKLEECLNGFVTALAFYNGSYMSGVEFTCEFNDSILADEESERQQDRQDVSMGVMSLLEYRMKWYNEDEETAKAKLPEQNQVME